MTTRTEQTNTQLDERVVVLSSSSGARARTRESDNILRRMAMESIRKTYRMAINQEMPPILTAHVKGMLESGVDSTLIRYGLQEAAFAPRPSWKYAEAVIRRLIRDGIQGDELIFDLIPLPDE